MIEKTKREIHNFNTTDFKFLSLEQRKKTILKTIQINVGNLCNQKCRHCHIAASPKGKEIMDLETAERIVSKIKELQFIKSIEFTGGTPEMNPHFEYMLKELAKINKELIVRTSLTILKDDPYKKFIKLYKDLKVHVIASLPGIFPDSVNLQRGYRVFEDSIDVLRELNHYGFGKDENLKITLVYNPVGDYLPPPQKELEREYKFFLKLYHNIEFTNLITLVNMPIKRFKADLIKKNQYNRYLNLLIQNFNINTIPYLMCKSLLSIDFKGNVYDCDFNLALNLKIKDYESKKFWEIDFANFNPEITFKEHCFGCMVNMGSSCMGELITDDKLNLKNKNENHEQKKSIYGGSKMDLVASIQKYYGEELNSSYDLKTKACCTIEDYPKHVKEVLPFIADEIKTKYYGCGSPIPDGLEGLRILDIGCGTGRDVYILSKLVGENGFVYGIDMTKNQIEIAERYIDIHTKRFGYSKPNVKFIHDFIENIDDYFEENSLDLIISNCVFNLIFDKPMVLEKIFKILKNGGEFYFSDNYSDRRIPEHLKENTILYNECLSGALYEKDFIRLARKIGFMDPRIVSKTKININNPELEEFVENIRFYSITYRLWKIKGLEDACEDYGQIAIYKGGIKESPFQFVLDEGHRFEKGRPERVCGNTALMLRETRYKSYFEVIGDFSTHYGEFVNCGTNVHHDREQIIAKSSCGC